MLHVFLASTSDGWQDTQFDTLFFQLYLCCIFLTSSGQHWTEEAQTRCDSLQLQVLTEARCSPSPRNPGSSSRTAAAPPTPSATAPSRPWSSCVLHQSRDGNSDWEKPLDWLWSVSEASIDRKSSLIQRKSALFSWRSVKKINTFSIANRTMCTSLFICEWKGFFQPSTNISELRLSGIGRKVLQVCVLF